MIKKQKLRKRVAKNQQKAADESSQKREDESRQKPASHHDKFFKGVYSDPERAIKIFQLTFSKKEFKAYDWGKLRPEKDSFKNKRADLVFSVPLKKIPEGVQDDDFRVPILLEHKSAYNPLIFIQLLRYYLDILEQTLKESGRPRPVIVVVFYHGEKPWTWPLSFLKTILKKFFAFIPAASRKSMLDYEVKVLDIHDPKIQKFFRNKKSKDWGTLNLFAEVRSLEITEAGLLKILSAFGPFSDSQKDNDFILNLMDYFRDLGMSQELEKRVERLAFQNGIFPKEGYMRITERLKRRGPLGRPTRRPTRGPTGRPRGGPTRRHGEGYRERYAGGYAGGSK